MSPAARDLLGADSARVAFFFEAHTGDRPDARDAFADLLERLEVLVAAWT